MIEDPLLGHQLANFRLERVIGRGGMAQVYYGTDVKLQRPVAIKVIDARYRNKPAYAERFVREARALATWRHENITQIYYADDEEELYYYVMEFVDGLDLGDLMTQYVNDGSLMPDEDVIRIGHAVAKALDYAHQRGIVHRDVKPSNVLVARNGRVLLTDFGLAMDVSQGSLGEVFGSPHYMSPEQARHSASAVPQSDLYSLGVILYEMLTGVLPFDDPAPAALALQHITDPPPPPREINPYLNEATAAVLLKALNKQPHERFETGQQLMDALATAMTEGAPDGTQPGSKDEHITLPPLPALGENRDDGKFRQHLTVAERIAMKLGPTPEPIRATLTLDPQERRFVWLPLTIFLLLLIGAGLLIYAFVFNPDGADVSSAADEASSPVAIADTGQETEPAPTMIERLVGTRPPPAVSQADATDAPTSVPTATPTPSPTVTPSPTNTPVVPPTVLYPDGRLLRLIYNESGFYVLNLSGSSVLVRNLAFEALDERGAPTSYRFSGIRWAEFYGFIQPEHCNMVELVGASQRDRPPSCEEINTTIESIEATNNVVFWLSQGEQSEFRVLWREGEIGRCNIASERCDIYLP